MKFQVNLQALEYWSNIYDVIMMLFYEVITKSQILSNKFIKKNTRSLPI